MVQPAKKRKTGGKYKARGGKSAQPHRTAPYQGHNQNQPRDSPHTFSLRDEVLNTGRSNHFWTAENKLRTKGIAFVSAGNLAGSLPEQTRDGESEDDDDEFTDGFHVDLGFEDEDPDQPNKSGPVDDSAVARSSDGIARMTLTNAAPSPPRTSPPPTFFVDTKPSLPTSVPKMAPPQVRNSSPTPSDSSDEVVFRGRNAPRVIADPFTSNSSTQAPSQIQSRSQSSRPGQSSTEQSVIVTMETTVSSKIVAPRPPAWDPTPVEWVHRSKPGIGWTRPKTLNRKQELVEQNLRLRQTAEEEAMADYMANLQAQQAASDQADSSDLDAAALAGAETIINIREEQMVGEKSSLPVGSYNDAEDEESEGEEDDADEDDVDDEGSDDDASFDSDEDFQDDKDLAERRIARMTDEHIARLLAKQEDLGLGSDELLIFDDSDGDIMFDGLDNGSLTLPQLPAAGSRGQQKKGKKGKGRVRDGFPSASLFADVLDQDPYNGFDVMDWDRPSLRPTKKGRKFEDAIPLDLDDGLEATLRSTWEKDRAKKRLKKAEREELRSQGLLGRGKHGKPDLSVRYENGMNLEDFRTELRQFLASTSDSLSLPPMDKHLRKGIHEIAMEFGLKSKSIGSGKNRYPKLLKTRNTIAFDDAIWLELQANINRGFFARLDRRPGGGKGGAGKRTARGGGAAMSGAGYRDGEVVGAAAPEIGVENRGRAMLEKMGWSSGMALGTATNQGILQPITHTVKTGKAGLG